MSSYLICGRIISTICNTTSQQHFVCGTVLINRQLMPLILANIAESTIHCQPLYIFRSFHLIFTRTNSRLEYHTNQDRNNHTRNNRLLIPDANDNSSLGKLYTTKSNSKMATIISGTQLSAEIKANLKERVEREGLKPKLAIVQVGNREDSNVYIRMKIQFAEAIGAEAAHIRLPSTISEPELFQAIEKLNQDKEVHGIITQLPFDCGKDIDADKITNSIVPHKDVDGLSVINAGKLLHGVMNGSSFIPCTPKGCLEMIKKAGIKIEGTRSVVIGRSKIVGSPMAQLLLWNNSTVTICHSRTPQLETICRDADILVVAVGRAKMVKRSWLKPGAIVIDCGINCIPDATKKSGTRLVGDVDYEDCKTIAGAITPVPGGVGPMTVAMLIANTVESASRAKNNL